MYPYYKDRQLFPTRAAMNELFKYGYDLFDVIEILENGYDCHKSPRSKDTIEKCFDKKGKTIRVVIAKSFNYSLNLEVWIITHFGITKKPKKLRCRYTDSLKERLLSAFISVDNNSTATLSIL